MPQGPERPFGYGLDPKKTIAAIIALVVGGIVATLLGPIIGAAGLIGVVVARAIFKESTGKHWGAGMWKDRPDNKPKP